MALLASTFRSKVADAPVHPVAEELAHDGPSFNAAQRITLPSWGRMRRGPKGASEV